MQPEMKALQDKYKDDPQKQQQELMKLYKKAKVNPLGGCLPMLLQLPILITLWEFVENSILLRQKSFLWVHDLSAPDVILHLPFTIPFFGNHISGLVLLMVASMAVQMKVSGQAAGGGAGGAQMKMMQYFMPVMMLFIFNNLSAGVNLYYVVYNVLSVIQQVMINKSMDQIEIIERVDKKLADKMKIQKRLEEKQKMKKA
jgi:YidC/Oxa1 family membrane protein insertase